MLNSNQINKTHLGDLSDGEALAVGKKNLIVSASSEEVAYSSTTGAPGW